MIGIVTQNTAPGARLIRAQQHVSDYKNRDLLILWISMSHYMRQIQLKTLWKKQRVVVMSWQNASREIATAS